MAVLYEVASDGFKSQIQVNYIAHWILTYYLLPMLHSTARKEGTGSVRIVCVSSEGLREPLFGVMKILFDTTKIEKFGKFGLCGLSKLANFLHARSLNSQYGPAVRMRSKGKERSGRGPCIQDPSTVNSIRLIEAMRARSRARLILF
jgi:NAD(P)-dependent dehydrogenase (short-subunit alcohol dehydrogenase family)